MSETGAPPIDHTVSHLHQVLTHCSDSFQCLTWSPDGSLLASGSSDSTVRLWDGKTGEELHVYESVSPTHAVLLVSFEAAAAILDMLGKTKLGDPDIVIRHTGMGLKHSGLDRHLAAISECEDRAGGREQCWQVMPGTAAGTGSV